MGCDRRCGGGRAGCVYLDLGQGKRPKKPLLLNRRRLAPKAETAPVVDTEEAAPEPVVKEEPAAPEEPVVEEVQEAKQK